MFKRQDGYSSLDDPAVSRVVYSQQIISAYQKEGRTLFADSAAGEDQEPLGELAAQAEARARRPAVLYLIMAIIPHPSPGKARLPRRGLDYLAKGEMIGGFALIAYPADTAIPAS